MQDSRHNPPFQTLGTHLKYLREHSAETLAEVSGAVEINEDILEQIEKGVERPSEEILMLLISHFNMQDNDAVQLWELAGYDRRTNPDIISTSIQDELQSGRPMVMLLAIDVRTQYTDGVEIALNGAGVVMTFTQAGGLGHPQPVARVGMSLQQAEAVSAALQHALLHGRYQRPKGLPAPSPSSSPSQSPDQAYTPKLLFKQKNSQPRYVVEVIVISSYLMETVYMTRINWKSIANEQFNSLSKDIKDDWSDLYALTSQRD